MESLTELYRIGRGPSSSHTIAPDPGSGAFPQRKPGSGPVSGHPVRLPVQDRRRPHD